MKTKFLTIAKAASIELDIKKSKFIAYVTRVNNEAEAKRVLEKITIDHKKANHNCFAYLIGKNDNIQRESDNGEPSGTAGVPILEVLKKNQLHDTLIVVTRYFGGIKLGAGGLIRAYSNSASQAIEAAGIVEKVLKTQVNLIISYQFNDKLQYYLKAHAFPLLKIDYQTKIKISTAVFSDAIPAFKTEITNLLAGNVEFMIGAKSYFEIPYQPTKE